ncbi:MAG: phosphoesterase PA-phosphatase, partial [Halalkalicoccus sp.]|nr:phosphoesterase PA-phosphatase [Halalkalicoccus sp.]
MALELLTVLLSIVAVVSVLLVIGTVLCIDRAQLRELRADLRTRLRLAAPAIGLLAVVLVINSLTRRTAQRLSWLIGFEITDQIYRLEGAFVAWVQTFQTTELTV